MNTTDYTNPTIIDQYASQTLAAVFITYPALLKLLGGVKGKTVLDIGCGAGWLTGKVDRAEALRQAQLAVRLHGQGPDGKPADYSSPFCWAAFVLRGVPMMPNAWECSPERGQRRGGVVSPAEN